MEYWESRFKQEGAMWKFGPSDSALLALDIFKSNNIKNILIPGMGYGRNAKLFHENGLKVTGIEISESAIEIAKANGMNFTMHHGSVTEMPFDKERYDGIFCYALIHLLNKPERRKFLKDCYQQLNSEGLMVFVLTPKENTLYGTGKLLSKDRFRISKGLNVFFYDSESITREFSDFGIIECKHIEEPIKFMENVEPIKLTFVVCKK